MVRSLKKNAAERERESDAAPARPGSGRGKRQGLSTEEEYPYRGSGTSLKKIHEGADPGTLRVVWKPRDRHWKLPLSNTGFETVEANAPEPC